MLSLWCISVCPVLGRGGSSTSAGERPQGTLFQDVSGTSCIGGIKQMYVQNPGTITKKSFREDADLQLIDSTQPCHHAGLCWSGKMNADFQNGVIKLCT